MSDNSWDFGQKLKKIRTNKKITLKEVAQALGTSSSFISMIENGKSGISLAKLQKLLKFYELSMADLIDESTDDHKIVKLEKATLLGNQNQGVEARLLINKTSDHAIEPIYFRFEPGCSTDFLQHTGQEFVFIIEGSFELILIDENINSEERFNLEKGDTVYHSSNLLHKWTNTSAKTSIFIAAVSPPSF